jgi:hypothetical protein
MSATGNFRAIYRLLANVRTAPTFVAVHANRRITAVIDLPDLGPLIAGHFTNVNADYRPEIARLNVVGIVGQAILTTVGSLHVEERTKGTSNFSSCEEVPRNLSPRDYNRLSAYPHRRTSGDGFFREIVF